MVDPTRTLQVGLSDQVDNLRSANFFSLINLTEFEFIIWDSTTLKTQLIESGIAVEGRLRHQLVEVVEAANSVVEGWKDWAQAGKTLVILVGNKVVLHGTQDSRLNATNGIEALSAAHLVAKHGNLVEVCGPPGTDDPLAPFVEHGGYDAILTDPTIFPLLKVSQAIPGQPEFVGGYVRAGSGFVLYLPSPYPSRGDRGPQIVAEAVAKVIDALPTVSGELPAWTRKYQLGPEMASVAAATDVGRKIADLNLKPTNSSRTSSPCKSPRH